MRKRAPASSRSLVTLIVLMLAVETSSEDGEGLFTSIRRRLEAGANCVIAGGGSRVTFEACRGCSAKQAWTCVKELRLNTSGSVPGGCRIEDLSEVGRPSCCAQFTKEDKPETILRKTAAYPETFTCLMDTGCMGSEAWRLVYNECKQNRCVNEWACRELQSPATRIEASAGLTVVCAALAILVIQLLSPGG